ncbi:MAG: ABC transporter permease [Gammaproteobacteria bacterium]
MQRPGYVLAVWAMLGLALAANAITFAVVYGFFLKPLPYPHPDQLAVVREVMQKIGADTTSPHTYQALQHDLAHLIAGAGLITAQSDEVAIVNGHPRLLRFEQATPSLFPTLGVNPVLGHLPSPTAGEPGGPPDIVLSWHFWQRAYGGSRKVLGRIIRMGGHAYRIVGVMPHNFFVADGSTDAWLPLVIPKRLNHSKSFWIAVRRKPGVSLNRLNLILANYRQRSLNQYSPMYRAMQISLGYTFDALTWRRWTLKRMGIGSTPWLLQGCAGLLLLLALTNIMNLGLVRQRVRQQTFAMRRVLGASRMRLAGFILIEHLPIVLLAGGMAMGLAWLGIGALHGVGLLPAASPFPITWAPAVISFTWILTVASGFAIAAGPAWMASRDTLLVGMGDSPTATAGRGRRWLQRTLGVVQIALATTLLVAAGLLGVSLQRILSQPLGFATQHRIAITLQLPNGIHPSATWNNLKLRLKGLSGVQSVAATSMLPFAPGASHTIYYGGPHENPVFANTPRVSSGFFSTMGIRLLAGRAFTPDEVVEHTPVVMLSEVFARKFFGSAHQALGKSLPTGASPTPRVVGVVHDIRWHLPPNPDRADAVYLPFGAGRPGRTRYSLIVHTRGSGALMLDLLRRTIQVAVPGSVVLRMTPLSEVVRRTSRIYAAETDLIGVMAGMAVLLAALGVFALTTFNARSRLMEYGIRVAFGADPATLIRLGFREAAWLLSIGLPLGFVGAGLLGRMIAHELYETPVFDAGLYLVSVIAMVIVVAVAALGPAWHASNIPVRELMDP